ncbi:MAG: hypothetical protein AAF921_16190, partial [Cyanobacteria bacterium P01_D01_bin.44]
MAQSAEPSLRLSFDTNRGGLIRSQINLVGGEPKSKCLNLVLGAEAEVTVNIPDVVEGDLKGRLLGGTRWRSGVRVTCRRSSMG